MFFIDGFFSRRPICDGVVDANGQKHDDEGKFAKKHGGEAAKGTEEVKQAESDSGETEKKSGLRKEPLPKQEIKQGITSLCERLNSGEKPEQVLKEGVVLVSGIRKFHDPEMGDTVVVVGADLKKEHAKYLYRKVAVGRYVRRPDKECQEIAERQLAAYGHVDDLLAEGKRTNWVRSDDHHSDCDFMTLYKRFPFKGKSPVFTLDIKRKTTAVSQAIRAHNVSSEDNPGFGTKKKQLKLTDGVTVLEVVRVLMR